MKMSLTIGTEARTRLAAVSARLWQHGAGRLAIARLPIQDTRARLARAMQARLAEAKGSIQMYAGRLDGLSPLRVMARGYAVVYRADDGHLVRRAGQLQAGSAVRLRWAPPGCDLLSSCDEAEATITRVKPAGEDESDGEDGGED